MHCHDLPIPEPCHESWEAMTGDDRRRHCASCDLSVVDLSALTRDEASVLLATRGEHRCVRYEHDAAEVIRFSDSKESGDKPAKPAARGHIEAKTINGCGPYLYLRYWSGKTLKSKYIGKAKAKE